MKAIYLQSRRLRDERGVLRCRPGSVRLWLARRRRWLVRGVLCAGAAALTGCTPRFDWREVRFPEAALSATFPCRPAIQQRTVVLQGQSLAIGMQVCDVGEITFALTHVQVADVTRVGAVLAGMRTAAEVNLGVVAAPAASLWAVPGMTPRNEAGQWRLAGQMPDGRPVRLLMGLASRGLWVIQASVLGSAQVAEEAQTFLGSVRFLP